MKSDPDRLRQLREAKGHSQSSLARVSGVSQTRIGELEAAAAGVRPPTAAALAKALGVGIADITQPDPAAVAS